MENKAFGIDLGTTYSCISYVDDISGEPVVVDNSEGTNVTPSIVCFEDDETVVVGDVAKETAVVTPDATCEFVKRRMGVDKVAITYNGTDYSPEQISSLILKKLVKDAETALDTEIKDVVITCPAYFGIAEKTATENAGKMAGLNVMEIINEPTAAALCYGSLRDVEDKTILVYDLGGGTFDVTIIRVTPEEIVAIATDGDHQLGGKNWDTALMNYLEDVFRDQKEFEGEFDLEAQQDLRLRAEKAKQQLTGKPKTKVIVQADGVKANIELTREAFDETTSSLLSQTLEKTEDAIAAAKKKGVEKIDEIILVGGSCKMPQVRIAVEKAYPDIPIKMFEPNEAVAKGAALHAEALAKGNAELQKWNESENGGDKPVKPGAGGPRIGPFTPVHPGPVLRNITSKSFGVQIVRDEIIDGEMKTVDKIANLITKQDSVPVTISQDFCTAYDNMDNAEIVVYETDVVEEIYDVGTNKVLGTAILDLPPNLPAGAPIQITFSLSTDGLLSLKGVDLTSNKEITAEMKSDAILTEKEVEKQTAAVSGIRLN